MARDAASVAICKTVKVAVPGETGSCSSFTWHPGRGRESSQEVECALVASRSGTLVELEHRGWERLVDAADEIPERVESGWAEVLSRYVDATTGPGARAGT